MSKNLISKVYKAVRALITRSVVLECDRIPFEFHQVPLRKILNWILVETSIFIKPEKPWGWPTHVQLEPTTFCNIKCALCPVSGEMKRAPGNMDFDLFKKLIDETGDYLFLILLWNWGEPFVNPSIYDIIAYARKKGIKVVSSTNGHVFAEEENAKKLVQSGIDTVIVAVDGITQKTYEKYRKSGNLETVFKGIRNIAASKQALHSQTPLVNFRFIAMKHNEHEIPELKNLVRSLGADVLSIKTLNPHASDTYFENRAAKKEIYNVFVPKSAHFQRFKYVHNGKNRTYFRRDPPCKHLWNAPTIHWDGSVCPCTYDYNEMYAFGNLNKNSFKNIWFGVSYRKMRRQFRSDWSKIQLCCNCSYTYEGGSCIDETIADIVFLNKNHE